MMSPSNALSRSGETLTISGVINWNTVPNLAESLKSINLLELVTVIDISNVIQADSSAISLLVLILGAANKRDTPMNIVGASKSIESLMELYDVRGFFNFTQENNISQSISSTHCN